MSQPSDPKKPRGVFVQKQTMNIYTVLLILSFVALLIGCIFLAMENSQ